MLRPIWRSVCMNPCTAMWNTQLPITNATGANPDRSSVTMSWPDR
ncbi:Uncharacterised protein [Mycobacterium tuberculosis]|nr:Uncharacterised protein [Mycobacterium tuberculosis]COY17855.1 Uncharacterised protein [Mycobacterium tuberculosis]